MSAVEGSGQRTKCTQCYMEVDQRASTCPYCRAHKKGLLGSWQSPRDARRNDIVLSILAALMLWTVVVGLFAALAVGLTSDDEPTYTPSCSRLDPDYPFC